MINQDRFDLYPRKTINGENLWYYRVYDEKGNRSSGKSTGQADKIAARQYVIDLIKRGGVEKTMSKPGKITLWILAGIILGLVSVNMYFNLSTDEVTVRETRIIREIEKPYYEREEINAKIKELQTNGGYSAVIDLYASISKDSNIAACILNNCLVFGVPVNVGFALCKRESNFNPKVRKNNKGNNKKTISYDYGLYQLNSTTFKTLIKQNGVDWLMEPENNIRVGLQHLRVLYDKYGSWDEAVIKYNGRFHNGADQHLIAVYEYEREFDRAFNRKNINGGNNDHR